MEVLILSGSVGKHSCTRTLLQHIDNRLQTQGANTIWWDLREKPLPIAVPEYHANQKNHPEKIVTEFAAAVKDADAFILGSPLYHDSYSGVLKNALDTLPNKAFSHKPVGLVSHSSNVRSCITPCNQLRPVIRSLSGYATQLQVGTTSRDYKESRGKLILQDTGVLERIDRLIAELLTMSRLVENTTWK